MLAQGNRQYLFHIMFLCDSKVRINLYQEQFQNQLHPDFNNAFDLFIFKIFQGAKAFKFKKWISAINDLPHFRAPAVC